MKVFRCFVLVSLLILVKAQLKTKLCSNNDANATESFATAIVSLFGKLLEGKELAVELLFDDWLGWECQQEYIFEKVMEKNRGKFTVRNVKELLPLNQHKVTDATLVISRCDRIATITKKYPQPYVHYCPNLNADELRAEVKVQEEGRFIGRNTKFLVKGKDNFIDLMSIAHFTTDRSSCRKPQLVNTNRFMINESRWLSTEFQTEPTRNFHGCEMIIGINQWPPYHFYTEHDNGSLEANGFHIDILKATASVYSFSLYFNAEEAEHNENNKYQYDEVDEHLFDEYDEQQSTQYLFYCKSIFLIPLGELYSDAAKLFMPLELEVWIAVIVTILIALLVIQIINRMSQQVQNFVFGRNVTTPTLNVMIAFVGGGQMILPRRNFARFLLILFIMFSLIIRTCHQSKYFEYLQGDFIKHEIQSINELIERNYTIYARSGSENFEDFQRFRNFKTFNSSNKLQIIENTLEADFKGAVLIMESTLNEIESKFKTGITSLKALKEIESEFYIYFPLSNNSLIGKQVEETIGRLHSAGLIDLWYKEAFLNINKPKEESEPTPLTIEHLTVGFVVSLNIYLAAQVLNVYQTFL